jgi:TatA/E family protein of Tat protein translocase
MVVIFFVALIVLGPKKLPELGRTLGKGLREFKKASDDLKSNWAEHLKDVETPVQDIKKTYQDAKAEVEEVSAKIAEEEPPPSVSPEEAPTAPAPSASEETKPDAN